MSIDNTNLAFSSFWDVDQLIVEGIVNVTTGITAVYTFTGTDIPVIDCQFRRVNFDSYYSPGTSSSLNTLATLVIFYTYVQNNTLYAYASEPGSVHYM